MPLYEYQCDECGHTFEKIQKFSDPLETECPKCGGRVRKLMSSPAIQFKGSGWYITDYAKKDSSPAKGDAKNEAKSDAKSDAKSESSGSGTSSESSSSETKSETKAEPAKATKPA
jgi:putative FmdB family regulatory protein